MTNTDLTNGVCPAPWLLGDEELLQTYQALRAQAHDPGSVSPDLTAVTRELVGRYIERAHHVYQHLDDHLADLARPGEHYVLHANHPEVSEYAVPIDPWHDYGQVVDVAGYYALNSFSVEFERDGETTTVGLGEIDLRAPAHETVHPTTSTVTWGLDARDVLHAGQFEDRWRDVYVTPPPVDPPLESDAVGNFIAGAAVGGALMLGEEVATGAEVTGAEIAGHLSGDAAWEGTGLSELVAGDPSGQSHWNFGPLMDALHDGAADPSSPEAASTSPDDLSGPHSQAPPDDHDHLYAWPDDDGSWVINPDANPDGYSAGDSDDYDYSGAADDSAGTDSEPAVSPGTEEYGSSDSVEIQSDNLTLDDVQLVGDGTEDAYSAAYPDDDIYPDDVSVDTDVDVDIDDGAVDGG